MGDFLLSIATLVAFVYGLVFVAGFFSGMDRDFPDGVMDALLDPAWNLAEKLGRRFRRHE